MKHFGRSGTVIVAVVCLGAIASACASKTQCAWTAQLGPWALKQNWTSCSDGKVRSVECRQASSSYQCQCLVGTGVAPEGTVGASVAGSFTVADLGALSSRESATRTVNARCALNLAP
jgi:hypothetical protein